MLRVCFALAAMLFLGGCDYKPAAPTPERPTAKENSGRYTITVANQIAVWRLDTKTGALEYCHLAIPGDGTGSYVECTPPRIVTEVDKS